MPRTGNIANLTGMGKGRAKGTKNKFTNIKQAFLEAFENLGGVKGLTDWAKKNPTQFYAIVSRLFPKEIHGQVEHSGSVTVNSEPISEFIESVRVLPAGETKSETENVDTERPILSN